MPSPEEEFAFEEAKDRLREAGLIVPRAKLRYSRHWYSWTDCRRAVYLGKMRRVGHELLLIRLEPILLHELVHMLVERVPIDSADKAVFGTSEEWNAASDVTVFGITPCGYVSAHATVHPEEDFVETAAYLLDGAKVCAKPQLRRKVLAIKRWFRKIRRRKRRS